MKTFSFNLCHYTITVTIEKKPYRSFKDEPAKELHEEFKMEVPKTVYECVTEYIESQRGVLSDATIKGYENVRNKHFAGLMSCRMKYIDEGVIQRSFDEEIEKGYSKKTIKGYRSFILKVLAVYRPDLHPEIRIEKEIADENT